MKTQKITLTISLLVLILAVTSLYAQAPQLINYQGKLMQADSLANGIFSITFSVYSTETGSSSLWTEIQTVSVTNGVFNILLGSVMPFPNDLYTASGERYLGIKVADDPEMTPRFRFASVAYAIRAANADTAQVAIEVLSSGTGPDGHSLDAVDGGLIDVVFVDSTGNVGIGTTSPMGLLHLDSRIMEDSDATLYFTHRLGITGSIQYDGDSNGFEFRTNGTTGDDTRFFIGDNGNVGIGLKMPQTKLQVNGSFSSTGNVGIGTPNPLRHLHIKDNFVTILLEDIDTDPDQGKKLISTANGYLKFGKFTENLTPIEQLVIDNDGNVGIGISTPQAKLHISGSAGVDGVMFPDGTLQRTAFLGGNGTGNRHSLDAVDGNPVNAVFVDSSGNVGIGTTTPSERLEVAGDLSAQRLRGTRLDLPESPSFLDIGSINTQAEQTYAALTGQVGLSTGFQIVLDATGDERSMSFSTGGTVDQNRLMTLDRTGFVGIGIRSPQAKLHIGGTAGVDGIMFPDGTLQKTAANGGSGTGNRHSLDAVDGDPTDVVFVDNDGSVGFGTITPNHNLDIQGKFGITSTGQFRRDSSRFSFLRYTSGDAQGIRAGDLALAVDFNVIPTLMNGQLYSQKDAWLAVESGNVGIGTSTPQTKLHIGGTAGVDGIMFPDGTLQTTAATGGNGAGDGHSLDAADGDPTDIVFVDSTGNVGIGTKNPQTKLHVNGTLSSTGNVGIGTTNPQRQLHIADKFVTILLEDNDVGNDQGKKLISTANGYLKFGKFTDNFTPTEQLVIDNDGNVGIGTSTPSARLDVVGATELNGDVAINSDLDVDNGTLYVDGTNNSVGIGTTAPEALLDVNGGEILVDNLMAYKSETATGENAQLLFMNTFDALVLGDSGGFTKNVIVLVNGAIRARFATDGNSSIGVDDAAPDFTLELIETSGDGYLGISSAADNDGDIVIVDPSGNVGIGTTNPTEKLHVEGNILATGTITPGSSRDYKEKIEELTTQESGQALDLLEPVRFYYKADSKKDLHMGFIAEDVPDLLATPDRKGVNTMDVVAVLTKVVQEQKKTIADMQRKIQALEDQHK